MSDNFQPRRVLSILFIAAIAVLFTLQWGPGARGCGVEPDLEKNDFAATVNGKIIPLRDFHRAYSQQLAYLRQQGSPITEDLAAQFGLPQQVLDQLVNTELLSQAAEARSIQTADHEVRDIIRKNPDFQKEGRFDREQYRKALRDYYRRTDVDHESEIRQRLAAQKLADIVESLASVSDDEVKARYFREGNTARATFVRFSPTAYADKLPPARPAELDAFATAHEKELTDYFQANQFLYHQPEMVKARHILIRAAEGSAAREEARAKSENVKKELGAGKDFAELAKNFSEDVGTKEKGGELGYAIRGRTTFEPALEEAMFSVKVGEVAGPIETKLGWHLIRVDEKRPPKSQELNEVRGEISRTLYNKDRAKTLAREQAQKALAEAKKTKKSLSQLFPASAEPSAPGKEFLPKQVSAKLESADTGEFNSTSTAIPSLGEAPELVRLVFALDAPALIDEVAPAGEGFALLQVTERTRPTEAEYTSRAAALRSEAIKGKQFELREAFLKALRKSATVTTNEELVAKRPQS